MRSVFLLVLLSASSLFADKAPFASQSDLVADLSDSVLNGIYHHRLNTQLCPCERSVWLEVFGSYRERDSSCGRNRYDNELGGILAGVNYALSCDAYLNFFIGGSWGKVDFQFHNKCCCEYDSDFDTSSVLFGMTWERLCNNHFYGFAFLAGYLEEERHSNYVHEEPRGVFLSPEFTYACQFDCFCFHPILTSTLRYAGFFSRDYQHRDNFCTLYVRERSVQLFTLRGELAFPLSCPGFEPYLGVAGRFQFDGNHVEGKGLQEHQHVSDGIDNALVYGLWGIRCTKHWNCFDLQGNVEGSYDSDSSWRILGELSINYRY